MLEIDQDRQRILDDLVRLTAFDIGNKSNPAGSLFQRRIKQAETRRIHHRTRTPRRNPETPRVGIRRIPPRATLPSVPARRGGEEGLRRSPVACSRRLSPQSGAPSPRLPEWDSNTVLCETWQILDADTSIRLVPGTGFCARSALGVDHGMPESAMGDRRAVAANLPRLASNPNGLRPASMNCVRPKWIA